ncbi:RNA polymerase sigma-70 factor [Marinifilum flexuosum]|uniref:RNA polymerase sigma-70 factor (ECF subfamily) n=1 Tax=Marinifilum flexuosum TaxID=1117708 RepID=A0A419X3H9_9BACT|nr:RNA polymerase sigma-70 factor [Marinifilum flexuosum]RKE02253.1 RNA polymerase sigma-70 factor (ECF subfamily) [Marinifilum flexuosum]
MQRINEKILLKGIEDRNQSSFRLLYETYHAPLFRFAESYVCCPGIAEDIVQDVFIKMWEERIGSINRSLKAYLFSMVRNRCIDYLRTVKVEDKRKLKLMEALVLSDSVDLSLDEGITRQIKKAIEELPDQCKEVYKMSVYDGLKHAEIAEELDISIDSVKVQVFRAKKGLRKKLMHLRELLLLFSSIYKWRKN